MVKAVVSGFISVLIFQVGWAWYFLGSPSTLDNMLRALTNTNSFPLQFWLIALFIFAAVFMTVRNMQKHDKKRRSRW